jgi:hypothetical protein
MEHVKFITKTQFKNIIKGDIEKMTRSDQPNDLLYDEPNEAIYEIFCGYQNIGQGEEISRKGIDFERLKDMNRLFSAKMTDAGEHSLSHKQITERLIPDDQISR